MIIADILFYVIIVYLSVYCIYQLFFFIKARNIDEYAFDQEKVRNRAVLDRRLCVLIYAVNKDKNLDRLLASLNNQHYDKENYEVHVIFQKEENDTTPNRDYAFGARIHNIQNPDYFSKDKALNLFIKRIAPEAAFDAYVFLGANRTVGEKYLCNINKSITSSGVYVGSKISINEKQQLAKKIKHFIISSYLKYTNRTYNLVRSMFNLPFLVDGENFVITSDVLDKIGYIGIENHDSELEYTLNLAVNGVKTLFAPYIITGINVKNYDFNTPSLRTKFDLYTHYFRFLFFEDITFKEFILFLLRPNSLMVLIAYFVLLTLVICIPQTISTILAAVLSFFLFANFIFSLKISKMNAVEIFWLMFYPVCLVWQKLKILINDLTMKSIENSQYEEENINSATIVAKIQHGSKNIDCKLDLISEDGMKKVVFREGNRFISTDLCLRMYDAMADMTYKLKTKGMTLKVCQNCEHFSTGPDGTLDCIIGKCAISRNEICIWNGCQYFYNHNEEK